jgi:cyclophilin family peptidyl-prolyl cis-trans isomerase
VPSDKRSRQRAQRAARTRELQEAQRRRRRNTRTIPIIVIVIGLAVALAVVTSGGKKKSSSTTTAASTTAASTTPTTAATTTPTAPPVTGATSIKGATPCPKLDGSAAHVINFAQSPPNCLAAGKTYSETLVTNQGDVVVQFDTTKTPNTASNFIVLSAYHYYDATAMFRTDTSIGIIQGGSPHTQNANDPGPGYTIKDEGKGFTYAPGDLVMARSTTPNSAGAQYFFCVTTACSGLNSQGTYVVFAHVTSGLSVLQKILGMNVNNNSGLGGAPSQLVLINKVTISES